MKKDNAKPRGTVATIPVWCRYDEAVETGKLVGNPRNPNTHPDKQIALLAKIVRDQGWRNPIVVSTRSGFIVKGHGRLEAAKLLMLEAVPVEYQDYETEATEYADLVADNRIAELAEPDAAMLNDLLKELDTGGMDMDLTGFTESEISGMMAVNNETSESDIYDQSIQMEPAKEFLCIILESEEFEEAKSVLGLKKVRRGGYKKGSAFDSTGVERCITWGRIKNVIGNTK